MTPSILCNLVLAAVDIALLLLLWRFRRVLLWLPALVILAAASAASAYLIGGLSFLGFRLLVFGVFLHLPLFLLCSAVLFWPACRVLSVVCVAGTLALGLAAFDAFVVEPEWLEVSRYDIRAGRIRQPVRIALIADLHAEGSSDYTLKVLQAAMEELPDLILFAGDYIKVGEKTLRRQYCDDLKETLRRAGLSAPLGIYAVRGNADPDDWASIFSGLPVTCVEETRTFDVEGIKLTCLGLHDSMDPKASIAASDGYHVVLGHYPHFALGDVRADLLLAGHTHGGQVRLPLRGPVLNLTLVPRAWMAGRALLGGNRTLIVSRGIGLESLDAPRMRLFCRPELVVIKL